MTNTTTERTPLNPKIRVLAAIPHVRTAIDEEKVSDFTEDLRRAVEDLAEAFTHSEEIRGQVGVLKTALEKRGFWGGVRAGFSGATDKELATMVQGLGASLHLTQNVVRVMLNILTQKNHLLHAFSEALVSKIAAVETDTRTLNTNQREAALHFLQELQQQVYEQIRHQELVDSHELRLADCEIWRDDKEVQDAENYAHLSALLAWQDTSFARFEAVEERAGALAEEVALARTQADAERARVQTLEQQGRSLFQQIVDVDGQASALGGRASAIEDRVVLLVDQGRAADARTLGIQDRQETDTARINTLEQSQARLQDELAVLIRRVHALEQNADAMRSAKARVLRLIPAAFASTLALATLYLTWVP